MDRLQSGLWKVLRSASTALVVSDEFLHNAPRFNGTIQSIMVSKIISSQMPVVRKGASLKTIVRTVQPNN